MTRWFSRLLGRDDPPTYIAQMRALWRVPADYTLPTSARVVPTKPKPQSIEAWREKYERKSA